MTYTFVRRLGQGGFGIVDEVMTDDFESFARKSLQTDLEQRFPGVDQAQFKRRFQREVEYQSRIDHPNVAKIVQSDLMADPPYYIMELAVGTLKDEIDNDRTLGGNPSKALFDILSGLEALHVRGIKHRDLKPENVLIFETNGTRRYAISDFGLITGEAGNTTTITASGAGGGTRNYAAPECINNFHKATAQSDIYSFGAILHDIFGGGNRRIPYNRLTVPDPTLAAIVERCTQTNPRRRYESVSQLREDLYLALNREEINFTSQEEAAVIELLNGSETLNDEDWDRVCLCLEENEAAGTSNKNIFRALGITHLENLRQNSFPVFQAIGIMFCEYVNANESHFDFDYCDVLAPKLKSFYQYGDIALQSMTLISLMKLGASHNRWYVERMFWNLITSDQIPLGVVERFLMDIEVLEVQLNYYIEHICRSISVNINSLPPAVIEKIQRMGV
jgi:serine/threonine protein kinase